MKTLSSHQIHLRIKSVETINNLNKLMKRKNSSSNTIINDALELALPQMIDTDFQTSEMFAEKLEKNTKKILRKLQSVQESIQNELLKIMILQSSIENLSTFIVNIVLTKMPDLSEEVKQSLATSLPDFINKEKQALIDTIFNNLGE